jgi:hypothetical protein
VDLVSDDEWPDNDGVQVGVSYSAPERLVDLLTQPIPSDFYDPGEENGDSILFTPQCDFGSLSPLRPSPPPSPPN